MTVLRKLKRGCSAQDLQNSTMLVINVPLTVTVLFQY